MSGRGLCRGFAARATRAGGPPGGRAPTLALPGRGHPRADLWSCRRTSTRAIRAPEAIKSIAHLVDLTRVAYGPRIANSYGYVWTWSSAQYAAVFLPTRLPAPGGIPRRRPRVVWSDGICVAGDRVPGP